MAYSDNIANLKGPVRKPAAIYRSTKYRENNYYML